MFLVIGRYDESFVAHVTTELPITGVLWHVVIQPHARSEARSTFFTKPKALLGTRARLVWHRFSCCSNFADVRLKKKHLQSSKFVAVQSGENLKLKTLFHPKLFVN